MTRSDGAIKKVTSDHRLAAAGRAAHAEPPGLHFQAVEECDKSTAQTREAALLADDEGVDIGHKVECLVEKSANDFCPLGICWISGSEQRLDMLPESPAVRSVDHMAGVEPC